MKGIYQYKDLKNNNEVVYVGKDSHIDKNQRYRDHLNPKKYGEQPFNRILQNNPDRYEYSIIWASDDCTDLKLNKMEILFGKIYNPKFNFDKFGKGGCNGHTEETKQKMSESHKGQEPWNKGKKLSEEHKQNISEGMKNKYATIIKHGFNNNGKRIYVLKFKGERLKSSIDRSKLLNWFSKNYPCEILRIPKKEE